MNTRRTKNMLNTKMRHSTIRKSRIFINPSLPQRTALDVSPTRTVDEIEMQHLVAAFNSSAPNPQRARPNRHDSFFFAHPEHLLETVSKL